MAGWQEAATAPDLTEWLTSLTDNDWQDMAEADETTVERRRTAHRDGRTPLEHFDHLHRSGMTARQAMDMTERWMANGGDQTTYTVTTGKPQERIDMRTDRGNFAGLYKGAPKVHQSASCGRTVSTPKTITSAEQLGQQWFEMRRNG